jgi:hypothetical protein
VQNYLIEEVSPSGTVTFDPSCSTDPCTTVVFDTTEVRIISFRIRPTDDAVQSQLIDPSDPISIQIFADYRAPSLSLYTFGSDG